MGRLPSAGQPERRPRGALTPRLEHDRPLPKFGDLPPETTSRAQPAHQRLVSCALPNLLVIHPVALRGLGVEPTPPPDRHDRDKLI
jgi:hypothetical protein